MTPRPYRSRATSHIAPHAANPATATYTMAGGGSDSKDRNINAMAARAASVCTNSMSRG